MNNIYCSDPVIIVNPLLPELIARHRHYFFRGREHTPMYVHVHPDNFDWSKFAVKKNNITLEDFDSCFVVDEDGVRYDMYLQVPCGKCDVCKVQKIKSFVKRCEYETECYDYKPWFVTLTYNDIFYHKPKYVDGVPVGGVNKRDCQLWLKRLRIMLERAGYTAPIRYVLVSEYGKSGRGHYHCILWNIQSKNLKEYTEVQDIIRDSWNMGYIMSRLVDPSDDRAFFYTTKYLKKGCAVPDGCAPCFMLSSRGNGGIGSRFIDKIAPELRKSLNVQFKFLSKWTGKVSVVQFSRYLLNRVFPSLCRMVNSRLRSAVRLVCDCKRVLWNKFNYDYNKFDEFISQFGEYFFTGLDVPSAFQTNRKGRLYVESCLGLAEQSLAREKAYFEKKGFTFGECYSFSVLRERFLGKLFLNEHPVDVKMRAYEARKILNFQSPFEVL